MGIVDFSHKCVLKILQHSSGMYSTSHTSTVYNINRSTKSMNGGDYIIEYMRLCIALRWYIMYSNSSLTPGAKKGG